MDGTTQSHNHPSGQPPQRVPLTQSMLYAYAAMRGNYDKDYPHHSDSLHTNLHLHPCCPVQPRFEQPVNLLQWQLCNDPFMMQESPTGAVWFQDVSYSTKPSTPPPQTSGSQDYSGPSFVDYTEFKKQIQPQYHLNHYTGDEGYANYGYMNVNGFWIDPESTREISDAEKGRLVAGHIPSIPIGAGDIVPLSEDEMYTAFVEEVSSGVDGDQEGDPRACYVTPAIIALWAVGASQGDRYVSGQIEEPKPTTLHLRPYKRLPNLRERSYPQFDENDGSVFSGEYTAESSPSLALSARGVDMTAQPNYYSYMNPNMRLEFDRAAYGDPKSTSRIEHWLSTSADTSPMSGPIYTFREEELVKALVSSDPVAGITLWNDGFDRIDNLDNEHRETLQSSARKTERRGSLMMERYEKYQEAYFLEKRVEQREVDLEPPRSVSRLTSRPSPMKTPFTPKVRPDMLQLSDYPNARDGSPRMGRHRRVTFADSPKNPKGSDCSQVLGQPTALTSDNVEDPNVSYDSQTLGQSDNNTTRDQKMIRRHKMRIEQFFLEQEERRIININKAHAMDQNSEMEIQKLVAAVGDLATIHRDLCAVLGVKDSSEIPDLIPVRKKKPRALDPPSEIKGGGSDVTLR